MLLADSSKLKLCGSLRTFEGIKKEHQEIIAHGNDVKKAKQFGNVIRSPLLNFPDESLILDAIPPMEIHLLLGVVNHLYKNLANIWPECKTWPEALNIPSAALPWWAFSKKPLPKAVEKCKHSSGKG